MTYLNETVAAVLYNESAENLVQGDVVIVDSSNSEAITVTTTEAYNDGAIGVVLSPSGILSLERGLVALSGYVPKIRLVGYPAAGDTFCVSSSPKAAITHSVRYQGDFGQVLTAGTTSPAAILWGKPTRILDPVNTKYVVLADVKSPNEAGQDSAEGNWTGRNINTIVSNEDNVYIEFSTPINWYLNIGRYRFRASAPGYMCGQHRIKFGHSSSSTLGTSEYSYIDSPSTASSQTRSVVSGEFLVTENLTTCGVVHYTQLAVTGGLGKPVNDGENEVYTIVELWKLT